MKYNFHSCVFNSVKSPGNKQVFVFMIIIDWSGEVLNDTSTGPQVGFGP